MSHPHPSDSPTPGPVRIANMSGFYGDRPQALSELLDGPRVDYITGDYLAELTMLILAKDLSRNPDGGYARTFLTQLTAELDRLAATGTKVISNAGGLNPRGLADAISAAITEAGSHLTVAYVDGDDLRNQSSRLDPAPTDPLSVNAYLGAWGIVECLNAGADIVITGRVTDASVIVAPAAHHFGWSRNDYDRLAGAVAAGHVIECGTQATGGNYAFFNRGELREVRHPGFPIAEIHADGSSVITKQPGTGGAVTAGTVTAQLLYEVTGVDYPGPDCTLHLDSVQVEDLGGDRVRLHGITGSPPPSTLKVCVNAIGGYRNEFHVYLTGLDVEEKAEMFTTQFLAHAEASGIHPERHEFRLERTDHPDADTQAAATAQLTCVCWDPQPSTVAAWARAAIGVGLATFPGAFFDGVPPKGSAYGVYSVSFVDQALPAHTAHLPGGDCRRIDPPREFADPRPLAATAAAPTGAASASDDADTTPEWGETRRAALGSIVLARSGDKGGDANIGLWVAEDAHYDWLRATVTEEALRRLLPEVAELPITIVELPALRAVNVIITGLLGHGVAHGARFDPQAKGLGEWLRSRIVDVPVAFLRDADHAQYYASALHAAR